MGRRRTLVIGVGNLSRRDDGLGWYAVNALRAHLGQPSLDEYDDGMDDLGQDIDSIALPQLAPELAELAAGYEQVIVVDARVIGDDGVTVHEASAGDPGARLLSHDMSLSELASLAQALYGRRPAAYLVSARGHDYDFGQGLSDAMQRRLPAVLQAIVALLEA